MSAPDANVSVVVEYRDSLSKAVTKNVIVVVLSISINYVNVGLVQTFHRHQVFYSNPRYILFFHLVVNDMIQVTLTVLLFIISYVLYKIEVSVCCVFILLALFTTENTPLNLAAMALECYVAVCRPLRHAQICTVRRTLLLIALIWTTSCVSILPDLLVTLATQPLGFFRSRVFCLRETAFPNPHIIRKRDVTYIAYLLAVWLVIFYTYFRILFTATSASGDSRKARRTIVLHGVQVLLCMATYAEPLLKQALQLWFPRSYSDSLFACYIIVQILPRSISPIIYGVRDQTFRRYLRRNLLCRAQRAPERPGGGGPNRRPVSVWTERRFLLMTEPWTRLGEPPPKPPGVTFDLEVNLKHQRVKLSLVLREVSAC